jgi:hypothetical protein
MTRAIDLRNNAIVMVYRFHFTTLDELREMVSPCTPTWCYINERGQPSTETFDTLGAILDFSSYKLTLKHGDHLIRNEQGFFWVVIHTVFGLYYKEMNNEHSKVLS